METESSPPRWTFLTNHTHLLVALAMHGDEPLRRSAERVGITERAARALLDDLEHAGVVIRHREGRRNRYEIRLDLPLRHPLEAHVRLTALMEPLLVKKAKGEAPAAGSG